MDVVVTVPKSFGWDTWIGEGDAAGEPSTGQEYAFWIGRGRPNIQPGERVYVVHNGKLRGYAPLVRLHWSPERNRYALIRQGGALAVTLSDYIKGFQGFRYRWWEYHEEKSSPKWRRL
jgi:hypothetical protein